MQCSRVLLFQQLYRSLIHFDESFSTLLFAARAMAVRTQAKRNEKIDFKYMDEHGRSVSPIGDGPASQNEIYLKNQNSQLLNKTQELKQEVAMLKAQLSKSGVRPHR